ncbi:sugar transporter SWEET1-like [Babylonia areolata]|uniref:sugar transporter SWEET1-like n=1 Tax=Babylonia areolata TaxID=304850 RepID=UPI003FD1A3C6
MLYLFVFYIYTVKKSHVHRLLLVAAVILFSPLLYLRHVEEDVSLASYRLGIMCCCLTVSTYMSPMASLKDVCRTKSVESMSFLLVIFNFLAAGCWFSYGTILNDMFVALPNLLGLMFGFVQLSLFCVYPSSRHKTKSLASTITA